ncbi:MAG: InlB B-repeat-containing protein [Paludibacteraceae bacterium]|nr:InlB B-repeat-containing protein [Paludibacteraceae bacterium]
MKKLHLLLLGLTICLFSACHGKLWDAIDDLDFRVAHLEELCKEMNTNITSIQTIVNVFQSNDVITSIVEIEKDGEVIGYTITFAGHDPITIYHGQNGADGKDGITPVIGVAQDTDGVYYWTLNGEWLLDDNGNKLPVSGKDGQNGANGSNGQDGTDGKDGITPQLKIEDGYWYISYDNGATWTQLGKATGEDGEKGDKGDTGDSMFQSVTQDENYVYFTLADGTVIKIAKSNGSNDQPNSEFIFTITYDSNGGEGVMLPDTFYYGISKVVTLTCLYTRENHYFTEWNTKPDGSGVTYAYGTKISIDKNIILYAQWEKALGTPAEYVDLGLSVKWATCNLGAKYTEDYGNYIAWGELEPKTQYFWTSYKLCEGTSSTITKYCSRSDYGFVDNKTILEPKDDAATVNWGGAWRMPTNAEFSELYEKCTCIWTTINGINGLLATSTINNNSIFLPAAGRSEDGTFQEIGLGGYYWTNESLYDIPSYGSGGLFYFIRNDLIKTIGDKPRCDGLTIRPVCL